MKKPKKGERVRSYLINLIDTRRISKQQLIALKVGDLVNKTELAGIGQRTILNMLNEVKFELFPEETRIYKVSKKKRVWSFLESMLVNKRLNKEKIRSLGCQDLINKPALQGIGKTTIICTLSEFKKQHSESDLEELALRDDQFLNNPIRNKKIDKQLVAKNREVDLLKSLIKKYGKEQELEFDNKVVELRELKMALHHMGINHKRLLKAYWEDVSQFRMTRFT